MKTIFTGLLFVFGVLTSIHAQTGSLSGIIRSKGEKLSFVRVQDTISNQYATSNQTGAYELTNLPFGKHEIEFSILGFEAQTITIEISLNRAHPKLNVELIPSQIMLNQMVITGTKTFKRQTESAVIVNVIDRKILSAVEACNLSEGLKFQPGLRVETDCQTCNYTQLRMNGLGGGYSQILINGRPIFSPLTGLYGLEQIPANMIERIEIVRGGGSALYGSSAIGGTVNVLTKIPTESGFSVNNTFQNINGKANDNIFSGNATVLTHKGNAGASVFVNSRNRAYYDHNGDNYSELPELKNNSFGTNLFLQPTSNQKLEVSLSNINEFRYGGEMVDKPAYLTQQSEERTTNVVLGSIDYQINFNNDSTSIIAYAAGSNTDRDHYTGIFPDDSAAIASHLTNAPYGYSNVTTWQGGAQLNHKLKMYNGLANVLTLGAEYLEDEVYDNITSYNYLIDQRTTNFGAFAQSDWDVTSSVNLLAGVRMDKHNMVNTPIFSPRVSLLYKLKTNTQFRLTWGTGFRAPQAFDSDLHIAFAGGGISRVSLSDDLKEERSNSLSASVNYDLSKTKYVIGFTLEGFYTHLNDAFYLHPLGTDAFGERFEKRNGDGATVQGGTLELRANYNRKYQLETGITIQSSLYDSPILVVDELAPREEFLRTPNVYGYGTLTIYPTKNISCAINMVYTGPMELVHFGGAPEQTVDAFTTSQDFLDIGVKAGYTLFFDTVDSGLELFAGLKNLTNAYQSDFDTGKNRDSNYIYGPSLPRTVFVGIKFFSL
jgi:outer membrane receptor for ferrienterochelin and colicins